MKSKIKVGQVWSMKNVQRYIFIPAYSYRITRIEAGKAFGVKIEVEESKEFFFATVGSDGFSLTSNLDKNWSCVEPANGKAINARATAGSYVTYIREMHKRTIAKASQKTNVYILNDMLACAEIEYSVALGDEVNER